MVVSLTMAINQGLATIDHSNSSWQPCFNPTIIGDNRTSVSPKNQAPTQLRFQKIQAPKASFLGNISLDAEWSRSRLRTGPGPGKWQSIRDFPGINGDLRKLRNRWLSRLSSWDLLLGMITICQLVGDQYWIY